MRTQPDLEESWSPGRPVPLTLMLGALRRGAGDPTMVTSARDVWWGVMTPAGPAATWWSVRPARPEDAEAGCTAIESGPTPGRAGSAAPSEQGGERRADTVTLRAYGPGAGWFSGRLPGILGAEDDQSDFTAHHDVVTAALRHPTRRHWRVMRTGLVVTSLVPSILEQKVTGKQAFGGFRALVRRHGVPVPLPADVLERAGSLAPDLGRLMAAPSAQGWRRIPSWEWLQAGVEPPQSRTVMRALEVAPRLEETAGMPLREAHRRMRSVPGLGVWTVSKVAQTAWGDADAPTFADYHVARQIGHALLGRDIDDAGMARLLEPYRGHRFRAEWFILSGGYARERHGARMALPTHLPTRGYASNC